MHLIYIDDSYEKPTQTFAAVAVAASAWQTCFSNLRQWRQDLRKSDGILVTKEFHATDFVAGRGRLGPQIVTKFRRSQIFQSAFLLLDGCKAYTCFPRVAPVDQNGLSKD